MKAFQSIFLLVLMIPFLEIYLLLKVGGLVGAIPTILMVVFTAVLGAWLLKQQGFSTLERLKSNLSKGKVPTYELIEGPIILVGGALLLTPGFITDIFGFICLIPSLRRKIADYIIQKQIISEMGFSQQARTANKDALEGEFKRED